MSNNRTLITGGSGSLGRALLERFLPQGDSLIVYSRDEWKQSEMRRDYPDVQFMLGDVRDYDRLLIAMKRVDVVIHAAAYKQVPSAEANVNEAIATNVQGSLNVARAAVAQDVSYVLGISTDKACAPINAYGQTKALMEKLFQQADSWGETAFNCVRYGNVLGSRGSVVPLFRSQLGSRCFTVTDPDMTRFWMTMPQAVKAVADALDEMSTLSDGAIAVPTCAASSMSILLEAVVAKWGTGDMDDYTIKVIGARPGEKHYEELIHANESMHTKVPTQDFMYYQILPATAGIIRDAGFVYDSQGATQLTVTELVDMLDESL